MDIAYGIETPDIVADGGGDDQRTVHLFISINESDGTGKQASASLPVSELTDSELAEALITCLYGLATMRGPGLAIEVGRRLLRSGDET